MKSKANIGLKIIIMPYFISLYLIYITHRKNILKQMLTKKWTVN